MIQPCNLFFVCIFSPAVRRRPVCTIALTRRSPCPASFPESSSPWTLNVVRIAERALASRTTESAPNSSASTLDPDTVFRTGPPQKVPDAEMDSWVQFINTPQWRLHNVLFYSFLCPQRPQLLWKFLESTPTSFNSLPLKHQADVCAITSVVAFQEGRIYLKKYSFLFSSAWMANAFPSTRTLWTTPETDSSADPVTTEETLTTIPTSRDRGKFFHPFPKNTALIRVPCSIPGLLYIKTFVNMSRLENTSAYMMYITSSPTLYIYTAHIFIHILQIRYTPLLL